MRYFKKCRIKNKRNWGNKSPKSILSQNETLKKDLFLLTYKFKMQEKILRTMISSRQNLINDLNIIKFEKNNILENQKYFKRDGKYAYSLLLSIITILSLILIFK